MKLKKIYKESIHVLENLNVFPQKELKDLLERMEAELRQRHASAPPPSATNNDNNSPQNENLVHSHFVFDQETESIKNHLDVSAIANSIQPENTIFVFDLHEVVLRKDMKEIFSTLFLNWEGLKLFLMLALNPFIWISYIIRLVTQKQHSFQVLEEFWFWLVHRHPVLFNSTKVMTRICNAYLIDPDTANVIYGLKQKNYKVYLLSNIGSTFWEEMKVRHSKLFALLDGVLVAQKDDNYLSKPNPVVYQKFIDRFREQGVDKIVFIDDKLRNLKAAFNVSPYYYGIHFTSGHRLYKSLKNWNVINN